MATLPISTTTLILLSLVLSSSYSSSSALNIITLLSSYPDLSEFTKLLISTSVAADLTDRSSLTILAVPNAYLHSSSLTLHSTKTSIADVIRYHILLQYLSWSDLRRIPTSGTLFPTLYQTTGRAVNDLGSVNITRNSSNGSILIRSPIPESDSAASIVALIDTLPYNLTIFTVNSLIIPYDLDTITSDTQPPLGLNITKALIDGHNFNVAASLLSASNLVSEFESYETGSGITLFVPTDEAFADLSPSQNLQSLSAEMKAVVLRFHVIHSYYPLGSLESIVNPVQPTLATESMGAGRFTLNIKKLNGSVVINTGIVQAIVTQTVCDQNPVAIFGVSRVLLPKEVFGKNPIVSVTKPDDGEVDEALSGMRSLGSESSSPAPAPSNGDKTRGEINVLILCIALYLMIC